MSGTTIIAQISMSFSCPLSVNPPMTPHKPKNRPLIVIAGKDHQIIPAARWSQVYCREDPDIMMQG